jgi:hypothetical protein
MTTTRWFAAAFVLAAALPASAQPNARQIAQVDAFIEASNRNIETKDLWLTRQGNTLTIPLPARPGSLLSDEGRSRLQKDPGWAATIDDYHRKQICGSPLKQIVDGGFEVVGRFYDKDGPYYEAKVKPGDCH